MFYVLTGLHGAGKSSVSSFASEIGMMVLNKRERFHQIHTELGLEGDWVAWYLNQYESGNAPWLIEKTVEGCQGIDVVYDSVHNPVEAQILSGIDEICQIRIEAKESIRAQRHQISIEHLRKLDQKRIGHQLDETGHNFTEDARFILLNNGTLSSLQLAFRNIILLSR